MFHPKVIAHAEEVMETRYSASLPDGHLTRYSVGDVRTMQRQLLTAFDGQGRQMRRWTQEEERFQANEKLLTKIDWHYWAERYCMILSEGTTLQPLYPLWESQELALAELGRLQGERLRGGHPDGLLFIFLKAAQLGMSTMTQSILAHRATSYAYRAGLIAADVPNQSAYLFDMFERVVEYLPFYLKPQVVFHTKDNQIVFNNGSFVNVESGKSMRGALQDEGGQKGQMGRGKTYSGVHLSELSTWEYPDQIAHALFPRIPVKADSFCGLESTAKGRDNWYHLFWNETCAGHTRFSPLFIPWFAVTSKYWLPAPVDWTPSLVTLEMAKRAELTGPRWLHRTVSLTRNQLYWWETRRQEAEGINQLGEFLSEWPTDPDEAFQYSGRTIFPIEVLQATGALQKPQVATWAVSLDKIVSERVAPTR